MPGPTGDNGTLHLIYPRLMAVNIDGEPTQEAAQAQAVGPNKVNGGHQES